MDVLWTSPTNQLILVCQHPRWSGTKIQIYFKLYAPRFMAASKFYGSCPSLKLIYRNTEGKCLCFSFQFGAILLLYCEAWWLLTASVSALWYFGIHKWMTCGKLVLKTPFPMVGKWQHLGTCALSFFLVIRLVWFTGLNLQLPVVKCYLLKVL